MSHSAASTQEDLQLGYAVVQLGLAQLDVIRQAYVEHQRIGLPGTFGQFLLARKLVDQAGLAKARQRAQQSAARASGRWAAVTPASPAPPRPVSGRHLRPPVQAQTPVPAHPAGPPRGADPASTLDYGGVIQPPRPQPAPDLTLDYSGVIDPKRVLGPSPASTIGFETVLAPQPPSGRKASQAAPATPPKASPPAPGSGGSGAPASDYFKLAKDTAKPPPAPPPDDFTIDYGPVDLPPATPSKAAPPKSPPPPASGEDPLEGSVSKDVVAIGEILAAPPLAPAAGDDYSQDELTHKLANIGGLAPAAPRPSAQPPSAPKAPKRDSGLEHSEDYFNVLPERPPSRDAPSRDAPSGDGPVADTRSGTGDAAPSSPVEGVKKKKSVDLVADPEEEFFASGGADEAIGPQPQVGERLGDFELTGVLGQGGMGIVFDARRADSPSKRYALKVLQPGEGDHHRARRVRFQREVETLRQLDHPNLVRVYGCGRRDGWDWYAMDYVEGQDLSKLLVEHRLSPQQKLEVFERVCEGMAHAHALRVVHRDLKPSNIRVSSDREEVRVLDFGLAKSEDEAEALTRTGSALGTPFYMAPEQFKNAAHVDARADVWALGVMLYEMMAGKRPFLGATAGEVVEKVLNMEPPRLRQVVPTIHADIEAICVKAMEKDARRRYPSAAELLHDLVQHRKGKGVQGEGAMGDARRWMEKHGTGFVAGVLVASAVWAVVVAWVLFWK